MHGTVWCKLFRRDFLTRHGLRFNPRMTVLEDNRFWIDAVPFLEKVAVAKTTGYFYRINFSGFTKNNSSENRILWWRLWRDEVFSRIDAQMREFQKQGDSELAAAYEKWRRGIILPMFWRALKGGVPVAEMREDIEMFKARGCYPVVSSLHFSFVSRVAARVFSSRFLLLTALRIRNAFK